MTDAAIVVDNLEKTYRSGARALDGVSFSVRRGEIFGLLGPNGAGKSTTVRILATLTPPTSGSAMVAGHDVVAQPQEVRLRIGYVAQSSGVIQYSTGRENLTLQAQVTRVPRSKVPGRVEKALEWVQLGDVGSALVKTYSGGMRRRLDVAMGLVHEPEVLFLDEPTTGLDPEARTAMWRDLERLQRERGLTVLLTTHYLEEADELCDRVAIVDHGRLVVQGTPAELKAQVRGELVTMDVSGEPERAAGVVRDTAGVLEVLTGDSRLMARVSNGTTAVPALVTALERAGVAVREVTLSRPSLDDVYLFHTGHRYAAGENADGQARDRTRGRRGGER
jgi:ABC-2 type transport system ATP-binding protein